MSRSAVSGVVRAARPATEGVRGTVVVDGGGLVLTNIQLQLIFWGTHWVNASITDVTNAVRSILGSNYMSSLLQYRGAGGGQLLGTFSVTSGVGTSPADPPNPFTNNDVNLNRQLNSCWLGACTDQSNCLYGHDASWRCVRSGWHNRRAHIFQFHWCERPLWLGDE